MTLAWSSFDDNQVSEPTGPRVAVLLCTYNGATYLQQQLDSIARQTHSNLEIWVSDDGSTDETPQILSSAQNAWGSERIKILQGPRQGFARNFLSLACHPEVDADYFAFCDQDDIWLPAKLERALEALARLPQNQACLYGGATRLVDQSGQVLGGSAMTPRVLGFENALVQNFAGGNTMVFNRRLREHLQHAGSALDIVSHDWWLYIVATAVGGHVVFDSEPQVNYRQHKGNLIGANARLPARINRIKAMSTGRLIDWLWINCTCLEHLVADMPAENQQLLEQLANVRRETLLKRITRLPALTLARQSVLETWILKVALMLAPRLRAKHY